MDIELSPWQVLVLPIAILLAIEVGAPLAAERNSAALPLLWSIFPALGALLSGDLIQFLDPFMHFMVGLMLIVAIPGSLGVFLLALRE